MMTESQIANVNGDSSSLSVNKGSGTHGKIDEMYLISNADRFEESASWRFIEEQMNNCNDIRDQQSLNELKKYFWQKRMPGVSFEYENIEISNTKSDGKGDHLGLKSNLNPFTLPASYFNFDLLSDSGTSNLTRDQIQFKKAYYEKVPDIDIFSYAGSTPCRDLEKVMKICFGDQFIFYPTLQGRAAEKMLLTALVQSGVLSPGSCIISNRPFGTTKGHIMAHGLTVKDLTPLPSSHTYYSSKTPFMGDIDPVIFEAEHEFACLLMTVTDNGGGGQPVSLENIELLTAKTHEQNKLVWMDGCRIYENACFIKAMDSKYREKSLSDIVKDIVKMADVVTVSFKKMYSHSGGGIFINRNSEILTKEEIGKLDGLIKSQTTAYYGNGYNSYSGLTGDGMIEIMSGMLLCRNESVVARRITEVCYVAGFLRNKFDLPIFSGGHAIYLAADQVQPNLKTEQCPAEYLNAIIMKSLGIRGCSLGSLVFGGRHIDSSGNVAFAKELPMDSLRLAVPREVYNKEDLLGTLSVLGVAYQMGVFKNLSGGLTPINYVDNSFYHFEARFELNDENEFNEAVSRVRNFK